MKRKSDAAKEWLIKTLLAEKDGLNAEQVFLEGEALGFSRRTLYRVGKELEIEKRPRGRSDGPGALWWSWYLPKGAVLVVIRCPKCGYLGRQLAKQVGQV